MLVLLPAILGALNAQNNQSHFENFSVEDGLPVNEVNKIHQDSQGFLWISTHGGLVRYDGYRFTIFSHDPADSFSIWGDIVRKIIESNYYGKRVLWRGLRSGFSQFDLDHLATRLKCYT